MLVVDRFPPWWPFLVSSYEANAEHFTLLVIHTGAQPSSPALRDAHIRYVHLPLPELTTLFAAKLGVTNAQAEAKFASGKGLSDLKPFYGKVFEAQLVGFSHWGWVDWDITVGALLETLSEAAIRASHAVTLGGATLGFAWAGQLTLLQNTAEMRTLYEVVDDFVSLGFKSSGDGQSGWEERVFLREVLRRRPHLRIHFHMAAQFDAKAQWLTWIPFDHYWHRGRVWRCGKAPLSVRGRPPYLVPNESAWQEAVSAIQTDPNAFYNRKDRVCIRWDLASSPWMCCPHATGVSYYSQHGRLVAELTPYRLASSSVVAELSAIARSAALRAPSLRHSSYDVCHEGAFFHAGLHPRQGTTEPTCPNGTWALQDDVGRFSGTLSVLSEACR